MHAAGGVALGHFLVDDAAAGGHPLDVAGGDGAAIPHAVAVLDGSGKHVSDGFDAAVRMPRKSRQIIFGNIIAEIVEEKKRVEVRGVAEAEGAAQMHARTFHRWLGFDEPLHRSNRHSASSRESLPVGCTAANAWGHPGVASFHSGEEAGEPSGAAGWTEYFHSASPSV